MCTYLQYFHDAGLHIDYLAQAKLFHQMLLKMEVIRYLCECFYLIVKIQHMTVCVGTLNSKGTELLQSEK